MENNLKSTHPLILVAAASLTLASLAATARFTGLIGPSAETPPAAVVATAPQAPAPAAIPATPAKTETPTTLTLPPGATVTVTPEASKAGAPRPAPRRVASQSNIDRREGADRSDGNLRRVSTGDAGIDVIPARPAQASTPVPTPAPAPAVCNECGTVESVREVTQAGSGTGLGAVAGGILGGVLGHQVGRGTGRDLATIAGAVGGAFGGHQIEKNVRSEKQYEVTVRFDDGAVRTYTQGNGTSWRNGDRVRLSNGNLISGA